MTHLSDQLIRVFEPPLASQSLYKQHAHVLSIERPLKVQQVNLKQALAEIKAGPTPQVRNTGVPSIGYLTPHGINAIARAGTQRPEPQVGRPESEPAPTLSAIPHDAAHAILSPKQFRYAGDRTLLQ
jgi:hypothetical protein